MKKLLLFTIGILLVWSANADIPDGYYTNAAGLTEDALKSALHNIINDHTTYPYTSSETDVWDILKESDRDPNNSENVILIYTGWSVNAAQEYNNANGWTREHVWAKSHGDFGTTPPAGTDAHHLRPCNDGVNSSRSDKDFDNGGTQHSVATECYSTATTWEPRDAMKGDVARMMFYMATRYEGDVSGEPDLELVDYLTAYPNPEFGVLSTLLLWHNEDPVDDFERNRNEVIYTYQNNRNPFIDHPEYVSKIWGGDASNPAPTISYIINTPEIPSSTETVSISATITDDGIITEAKMNWGLISGDLINTITCTNTSGDLYTTDSEIPAQTDGTIVYYEIEAMDDSSGVSVSKEFSYEVDNNPPTEILNEDFTSCPATGWTSYSVSGSEDWECSGNGYLYINAYGGTGASDDWYISPSIDLDLYNNEYLAFSSWTNYSDTYSPTIELKYSTNYSGNGDPNNANWTDLSATWSNTDSQTWTESGEIDLSGVSGTNVYIAFRYTSSGNASGTSSIWEIDNIFLSEKANILPEISEVTNSPSIPATGEDVAVTATIIDSDGDVASANILWGTTSGTYPNSISMSNTTGDSYSGIIPAQAEGTFIYYIIEATDNSAEVRQSREHLYSYNTAGNSAPTITNIAFTPEIPGSSDDVTVSATITDTEGPISIAHMKWGTAPGNYEHTVELEKVNDTYSGYIPARPEDTEIYFIIYSADNNGGSIQTAEYNYIVNDPPEISEVDISPDAPTESESVTVSASVTDKNSSIASVILKWKTETGSYTNVDMNFSDNKYTGTIPAQASEENILFSIEATDNLGATSNYTIGNYEVATDNPPEISDIVINPENPTENESVTVSASVTDEIGSVTSVVLKWKTETGTYTNVNMNFSSNRYSGVIPSQAGGENISFSIEATDNIGGISIDSSGYYEVSGSNSILDIYEKRVSMYPNPASEMLNIEVENYTGYLDVHIYNIIGSLVYSEKSTIDNRQNISLSHLKSGMYFVELRYENKEFTQKIIIKN